MSESDDIRTEPETALRQMVESEGWAIFMEYARGEFGSIAQNRRIRAALTELPAAEHSIATQSILATADRVREVLSWPEEEMARLQNRPKPEAKDRFANHRLVAG